MDNVVADALSRLSPSGDYEIRAELLQLELLKLDTRIQVDWFADSKNHKHDRYYGIKEARNTLSMTVSWKNLVCLMHPPLPLMLRCLSKVRLNHALAVVIPPFWPGMVWSVQFRALTVKRFSLGRSEDLLCMSPRMRECGAKLSLERMSAVLVQG